MTFEQLYKFIQTTWLPDLPKNVSMSVLKDIFEMQMAIYSNYHISPSIIMDGFDRTMPINDVEELRIRLFELEKNLKSIYSH